MAGIDKITRVLMMHSKLLEGGKIYKKSFCEEMGIDRRTFDRDIEDIRLFLSESFYGNELIYDRKNGSYHLENFFKQKALSAMEVVALLECLKSCCNLPKDEYSGLISSVLAAGEQNKRKTMKEIAKRYLKCYDQENAQKTSLKMQWDLQQCIADCDWIHIHMKSQQVFHVAPVSIWIYAQETYLFGYLKGERLEVFRVADIEYFQMGHEKFPREWLDKFDELKWETIREKLAKERIRHEKD